MILNKSTSSWPLMSLVRPINTGVPDTVTMTVDQNTLRALIGAVILARHYPGSESLFFLHAARELCHRALPRVKNLDPTVYEWCLHELDQSPAKALLLFNTPVSSN